MIVLSLGTGTPPTEIPTYEELWSRGWLRLGMAMLSVAFDGTSEIQDEVLRSVIAKKEPTSRYVRFQPELRGCSLQLDDARPANIRAMLDIAETMIERRRDELQTLVAQLLTLGDERAGVATA